MQLIRSLRLPAMASLPACAMACVAALAFGTPRGAPAQASDCSLESWAEDIVGTWRERSMIDNTDCYARIVTSMEIGRRLRDEVLERLDAMFPRAGYKVVGLDPINAALPGVDRPMVGALYVSMFVPNGSTIPLDSAELLVTEPDFLVSIADEAVNEATSLEEALPHLDRIYAFIEVLAPVYDNNPPNPYLMQASNISARWGVIGDSVAVRADDEFLRSLETMRVTFVDGDGEVYADQPGSYLGRNPLNGVLVVIDELKRRGERLRVGDLVSSGSYMPPMRVQPGMTTETVYEGLGGTTLRVSATYR
jgi:2-keto-4-pentenoate hydratase